MKQSEKAEAYNRIKRRLGYAEFIVGISFLAFLASGPTFDLRNLAVSAGGGPVVWILVYFVIGVVFYEILTLPLNYLSGYFLEKRFGLLNQSFSDWVKDLLKAQVLGLVLGIIAVETLYLLIRWTPDWWWLPAGTVFAVFFVVLAQLTPVVILPLFFKFEKLPEDDRTTRLNEICRSAGVKVMGIYEWGMSEKTVKANAALVGWGSTRRVVLSDSLLNDFNASEVEVVLAHELGHHRLGHLPKLLILQILVTFTAFLAADLFFNLLGPSLGIEIMEDIAGMPLFALVFTAVGLLTMPVVNAVSRALERQADAFALQLTGLVGSFISAMERLAVMNMSEIQPGPVIEFLFHSHPSPASRIAAAKEFLKQNKGSDRAVH